MRALASKGDGGGAEESTTLRGGTSRTGSSTMIAKGSPEAATGSEEGSSTCNYRIDDSRADATVDLERGTPEEGVSCRRTTETVEAGTVGRVEDTTRMLMGGIVSTSTSKGRPSDSHLELDEDGLNPPGQAIVVPDSATRARMGITGGGVKVIRTPTCAHFTGGDVEDASAVSEPFLLTRVHPANPGEADFDFFFPFLFLPPFYLPSL
ncbi:hypothetical protein AMTR_s00011p00090090 [Amborella trichopoda]|uniref:Uncharacterized protein n=1 Tax=Amborella trichopoda TaxID=13333 RepID=W1NGH8_AMBTC|nr:hypothetical protein AMTR_s00011p00090090 [Amborella trichopoda]